MAPDLHFTVCVVIKSDSHHFQLGQKCNTASANASSTHHSLSTVMASEGVKSVFVAALSLHSLFHYVVMWVVEHAMAGLAGASRVGKRLPGRSVGIVRGKECEEDPADSHCVLA